MTLNLRVMAPNRTVWTSEAQEIILSSNSGQIGILPNHAPLLTALDIGVMKVRIDSKWTAVALMGGFAQIENNQMTILVNEAEKASDIDPKEAQEAFDLAETSFNQAVGRKQTIEANLAFKRAKARLEAVNAKY
uniref:ATP synthase epsilon chain, chloroplastic n=1 Tax=Zygnema circumcarinatum TaxID=35869 RepID=ATPE_ZYGCR|nr:CF1 epsilon subunit of ATP synthase [Zygnema circumcarinatum]Q32RI1.1 RecName: Full=ATP synthase epsilon chain, chloroplastic; AltName: Full=ATP synthase F1 sector epsilon subunit; AltName: Full=F-ATPase epsilon subunit [Zygnema circumcarinatum]AAX45797.1 CF1 epsilon subunit of ATP synthase [Zygnema circumcarinatum]